MSTTPYTFIQAGDKYIISLENHCEIVEAIATFCRDNNITAGIVGGIGAVNTATLRFFNPSTKKYIDKTFTEQMEIANLTGNIAVTMVLATLTFLVTNIFGTKHYWKEIFWPDVPLWLKFPLPIMPLIEVFGMFTKPAALTVRLFANMMGGHMIVLVLTLLIFIFSAVNPIAGGATTIVSVLFSVFMLLIDVLVSFIQAYVFTMLSTIFISLAQERGHDEAHRTADKAAATPAVTPATVAQN